MLTSLFSTSKKTRKRDASSPAREGDAAAPPVEVTRTAVAECLKYVVDPEVGINIVDLGLIYDLQVALPAISLKLTMTTPACPMSRHIARQARTILERVRGAERVEVALVWNPAWTPQMMDPGVSRQRFSRRFAG